MLIVVAAVGVVADLCAEEGSVTGLNVVDDEDEDSKEEEAVGAITAGEAASDEDRDPCFEDIAPADEDRDPCFEDIAPAPLLEALAV